MSNIKIRKYYLRDIKHQVGASPIWPVSAKYSLGDYGYYSRRTGHFAVRGNLFDDLDVPRSNVIVPQQDPPVKLFKVFNSSNTTKNEFSVSGNVPGQEGKLELAFDSNKSYFFHMFNAEVAHLKLNDTVKTKLVEARQAKKWDYRYRIIEQLYVCPDVRFVFSVSKNANITLHGDVADDQNVSKGAIDYKLKSSSNMDGSMWIENAASSPFAMFASFKRRELKFHDEKILLGEDWHLTADNTSSFDEEDFVEEQLDSLADISVPLINDSLV